ncbi:MAG: lysyl oxidase family protein [Bacteroidetes bacterium]|nr:lysyl oxidase family protein [Bacteroidota bacterium]MDA0903768.1 lysyl oxidase family protein [Bacteroidota bacterium]MDA1242552.1 lysyl oxidase family protein [Bacteroidota bacterium]
MNLLSLSFRTLSAFVGLAFASLEFSSDVQAQCETGESLVVVEILTDGYPGETSWELVLGGELVLSGGPYNQNGTLYSDTLCFPSSEEPCLQFEIFDSYGDGICCGYGEGSYTVTLDGVVVATGGQFSSSAGALFACAPGETCNDAIPLTSDDYGMVDSEGDSFWYSFTPDANGMYTFSSCGNGCDTRLYIYDYCQMGNFDDTNEGTIYYDNNQGGCGEEAQLTVLLEAGVTYFVRWASFDGPCAGPWQWEFGYGGPPAGCTDPDACNYNPMAELDNGSCTYPGDPDCTGPDLIVNAQAIVNSLSTEVMQVNENDCYIDEGCLNGFGARELVRFTTHIQNIGDLDYYIGVPSQTGNNQFEWGDCHNHWHHKGYAKYDLFTLEGQIIPIGFKNGFCVMDLECSGGGTGQYGCGNMGISAGCGDIYGAGLSCQWIDVTDVEDGTYYLLVRANYDFIPDALGRNENSYENNHAAVCIQLDRSSGSLAVETVDGCEPFTDCLGVPFGTAMVDCNGDCNGTALVGDLDANGAQEYTDAVAYVEGILGSDIAVASCTDIDQDGEITVSDAALMSQCQWYNVAHEHPDSSGFHNKCNFPVNELTNIFDTVHFMVAGVNWDMNYFDVHVMNPNNRIVGYELVFSGVNISDAISLADPIGYDITPSFVPGGNKVIGLSYDGASFHKNLTYVPFLRVYWSDAELEVCMAEVVDVVNEQFQNTLHTVIDGCVSDIASVASGIQGLAVWPNPMTDRSELSFPLGSWSMEILDMGGRVLDSRQVSGRRVTLDCAQLGTGSYMVRMTNEEATLVTKFVVHSNN